MLSSASIINGDLQKQPALSPSQIRERFEACVRCTKSGALFIASLHLLFCFFGFCALTWATIVLLGGFSSSLRTLNFFLVSVLIRGEGAHLFIVQVFSKIFSKTLFCESHCPQEFLFKDTQYNKANRLDPFGQAIGFILASASFITTIIRLNITDNIALSGNDSSKN